MTVGTIYFRKAIKIIKNIEKEFRKVSHRLFYISGPEVKKKIRELLSIFLEKMETFIRQFKSEAESGYEHGIYELITRWFGSVYDNEGKKAIHMIYDLARGMSETAESKQSIINFVNDVRQLSSDISRSRFKVRDSGQLTLFGEPVKAEEMSIDEFISRVESLINRAKKILSMLR